MKRNALVLAAVMGVLTAASGILATTAYGQTAGAERRGDRRENRQGGREEKQECKAGDEKTRPECRQDKRDTKQEGRQDENEAKPEEPAKPEGG
jgi:hypothetical protein